MNDQWTPATTHVVIATPSGRRYWDDLATRVPHSSNTHARTAATVGTRTNDVPSAQRDGNWNTLPITDDKNPSGAPLLDWWEIPDTKGEPMTTRYLVGDVFDRLAEIPDGSVDLVVTSPPFLALRSYLPADHPDKGREIGSEPTPAAFIDVMLAVTAELRRVLAPHGSIAVELGDTYAGSGGAGGDYNENGWREGQHRADGSARRDNKYGQDPVTGAKVYSVEKAGNGWPLAKSRTMIPQLYEVALAYGINPLTGEPSPAGKWRVRNVVTWCRPNPPVGALGDKWRPATSDVVVACVSDKRYWDDLATRTAYVPQRGAAHLVHSKTRTDPEYDRRASGVSDESYMSGPGAPLLDYWVIPPRGYSGAHYAVYPQELVVPLVKAMCPQKVCLTCGEPSRRVVGETEYVYGTGDKAGQAKPDESLTRWEQRDDGANRRNVTGRDNGNMIARRDTLGFTDCGHNDWRPGVVLDPFAGSGTTLAVAHGHGHDSVGIDLDQRNAELAQGRLGLFLEVEVPDAAT